MLPACLPAYGFGLVLYEAGKMVCIFTTALANFSISAYGVDGW